MANAKRFNYGSFFYKSSPDFRRNSSAQVFLRTFFKDFVAQCIRYYNVTKEPLVWYKEKQLASAIAPALRRNSRTMFMEQPITRGRAEGKSEGRVDYWVSAKRAEYLIETKHVFKAVTTEYKTEKERHAWSYVIEQTRDVTPGRAENWSAGAERIFRVAMLIMTMYVGSEKHSLALRMSRRRTSPALRQVIAHLHPQPSWTGAWFLNRTIQGPFEARPGKWETYPVVALMCLVEPLN